VKAQTQSLDAAGNLSLLGEQTVHRLGFGAMRITGEGVWGPPRDKARALAVLRRALELGVNFIDTADSYGPNVSEELIAEALSPYPKGLVIATKGGYLRTGPNKWTPDGSPDHLRKAIEGSLKRLRLERIQLYQFHTPDPNVPFEESVGAVAELRAQGKVQMVGLSNVTLAQIDQARKIVPIASVQNRYSFAYRESDPVVDYCQQHEIAFIPWFPLGAGKAAPEALNAVAKSHDAGPYQVALAWLLRRSPIVLPIPGTSSIQHLEENMAAGSLQLTDAEFQQLQSAGGRG
jgi:aryl-alcohol dehydrogenase-like predicted oxidoreductase